MKITGNEPYFAKSAFVNDTAIDPPSMGLTIRQQFAMTAMQGLCANYLRENVTGWNVKTYAVEAVELADALIAEINRTEANNV